MIGAFLQSPEWEQMNQVMGRKTWRVRGILVIEHKLSKGFNYLYCPRPELSNISFPDFLSEVFLIAQTQKSIFFKIDPVEKISLENIKVHKGTGRPLQPQQTIVMDLSKSEDELLNAMHEKTRYNIRLSQRKGVEITQVLHREAKHDFSVFWNLLQETSTRGGFHLHARTYYELLSKVRTSVMSNEFFFAHARNDHDALLAATLVNIHHDPQTGASTATYLHGASSRDHKELMAPYLLHWSIIQEAKKRNIHYYDFWGIDEKRWSGITRFKKGFGGSVIEYPRSVHIVYRSLWYGVYKVMKFVTRR